MTDVTCCRFFEKFFRPGISPAHGGRLQAALHPAAGLSASIVFISETADSGFRLHPASGLSASISDFSDISGGNLTGIAVFRPNHTEYALRVPRIRELTCKMCPFRAEITCQGRNRGGFFSGSAGFSDKSGFFRYSGAQAGLWDTGRMGGHKPRLKNFLKKSGPCHTSHTFCGII